MKKVISWILVIPALIIICSEFQSLNLEWFRFLAILILIGVAFLNHAFGPEQIPNRRLKNETNYQRYVARYGCACVEKCCAKSATKL